MDKDRVKGAVDEVVGSAKQKVGKLSGDSLLQVDGTVQAGKGNIESAWGKAKDAVREDNENTDA